MVHQSSGRLSVWDAVLCGDLGVRNAGLAQHLGERLGIAQTIPRLIRRVEVGTLAPDRVEPDRADRLEPARPPIRDGELAARAHHAPQLAHLGGDIGREEDAEDADHGIERAVGEAQVRHVAEPELDVDQPAVGGLVAAQLEQPLGEVDADDMPPRADDLGRRQRRGARATADVEHLGAGRQAEPGDRGAGRSAPRTPADCRRNDRRRRYRRSRPWPSRGRSVRPWLGPSTMWIATSDRSRIPATRIARAAPTRRCDAAQASKRAIIG